MSVAEKLTTIDNAFKNIKSAILGKGASVSGDITTFADAVASIPVGSQVVTGQVSGSGGKTLTIPDAIGKDNIVVFLINTSTSSVRVSAVANAGVVGSNNFTTYKNSSDLLGVSATWNKSTGTITAGSLYYYFSNSSSTKYVYVAW